MRANSPRLFAAIFVAAWLGGCEDETLSASIADSPSASVCDDIEMPVAEMTLQYLGQVELDPVLNGLIEGLMTHVDIAKGVSVQTSYRYDTKTLRLELPGGDITQCERAISDAARFLATRDIIAASSTCACELDPDKWGEPPWTRTDSR